MDNTVYEGAIKGSLSKDRQLKQLAKFIRDSDICFETMDVKKLWNHSSKRFKMGK